MDISRRPIRNQYLRKACCIQGLTHSIESCAFLCFACRCQGNLRFHDYPERARERPPTWMGPRLTATGPLSLGHVGLYLGILGCSRICFVGAGAIIWDRVLGETGAAFYNSGAIACTCCFRAAFTSPEPVRTRSAPGLN